MKMNMWSISLKWLVVVCILQNYIQFYLVVGSATWMTCKNAYQKKESFKYMLIAEIQQYQTLRKMKQQASLEKKWWVWFQEQGKGQWYCMWQREIWCEVTSITQPYCLQPTWRQYCTLSSVLFLFPQLRKHLSLSPWVHASRIWEVRDFLWSNNMVSQCSDRILFRTCNQYQ